jgi:hypothetical protein
MAVTQVATLCVDTSALEFAYWLRMHSQAVRQQHRILVPDRVYYQLPTIQRPDRIIPLDHCLGIEPCLIPADQVPTTRTRGGRRWFRCGGAYYWFLSVSGR